MFTKIGISYIRRKQSIWTKNIEILRLWICDSYRLLISLIFPFHAIPSFLLLFDDSHLKFSISTPLVSTFICISCINICLRYDQSGSGEGVYASFIERMADSIRDSSGKITLKVHSLPFDEIRRTNYGLVIVYPGEEGIARSCRFAPTRTI